MEESANKTSNEFKEQGMDSSAMCSRAMGVAYMLVINKLKQRIE
jgi:hypothetical protein